MWHNDFFAGGIICGSPAFVIHVCICSAISQDHLCNYNLYDLFELLAGCCTITVKEWWSNPWHCLTVCIVNDFSQGANLAKYIACLWNAFELRGHKPREPVWMTEALYVPYLGGQLHQDITEIHLYLVESFSQGSVILSWPPRELVRYSFRYSLSTPLQWLRCAVPFVWRSHLVLCVGTFVGTCGFS